MSASEPFLQRWARRKADSLTAGETNPPRGRRTISGTQTDSAPQRTQKGAAEPPPLPSVETLTAEADFSAFMAPGVPSSVRTAALRRLWRLDPSLSTPDGLVEYGEDFAARGFGEVIRTAFRIGWGLRSPDPTAERSSDALDDGRNMAADAAAPDQESDEGELA